MGLWYFMKIDGKKQENIARQQQQQMQTNVEKKWNTELLNVDCFRDKVHDWWVEVPLLWW